MKRSRSSTTAFTWSSPFAASSARTTSRSRCCFTVPAPLSREKGSASSGCSTSAPSSATSSAPSRIDPGLGLADNAANSIVKNSSMKTRTRKSLIPTRIFQAPRTSFTCRSHAKEYARGARGSRGTRKCPCHCAGTTICLAARALASLRGCRAGGRRHLNLQRRAAPWLTRADRLRISRRLALTPSECQIRDQP